MKTDVEQSLRTLRWRDPPPEFLEHTLEVALAESRQRHGVRRGVTSSRFREANRFFRSQSAGLLKSVGSFLIIFRRAGALQDAPAANRKRRVFAWLAFIPRPLRLPLAACWLLALYFRLTTPEAIPQATLENYAKLPPVTPAQLIAHLAETERLANELLKQRRGPIPPL